MTQNSDVKNSTALLYQNKNEKKKLNFVIA